MVDLKRIGAWFTKKKLWDTPFNKFTEDQINELVTVVLSSPGLAVPPYGWKKPFLTQAGELIIPPDAHPKYRWWQPDGQGLFQTLTEIEAPQHVIDRYVANAEGTPF